jgi:hypothetical protein
MTQYPSFRPSERREREPESRLVKQIQNKRDSRLRGNDDHFIEYTPSYCCGGVAERRTAQLCKLIASTALFL